MYTHTYMHTYIYTCIHTYIRLYMPACIHAYIHTHTHTHTLTHTHSLTHSLTHTHTHSTPPLHLAVWKGRLETAEWLLTVCNNLHYGTQFTCFTGTKVQILTQKAHAVNDYGCDTSHWAAMSGEISDRLVLAVAQISEISDSLHNTSLAR